MLGFRGGNVPQPLRAQPGSGTEQGAGAGPSVVCDDAAWACGAAECPPVPFPAALLSSC